MRVIRGLVILAVWTVAGCGFLALYTPASADPAVSNVRASRVAGTKLVDIYYDLASPDPPVTVSVGVSADGGATYSVAATHFTGDVGAGVQPGTNRHVVWDAGADWDGQYSPLVRFKVSAADTPPAPAGMALIPAGSFEMGDSFAEGVDGELPVHSVYVSAFFMDRYEVTKALWDEVATWAAANGYDISASGASGVATNHPAYYVNWYECVKWCNARSEKEGLTPCYTLGGPIYRTGMSDSVACNFSANGYRLPTEAEWEKAARGGPSGRRFPWGDADTISHGRANYYSSVDYGYDVSPTRGYHPTYNDGTKPYTSPVGSFAANGYGLYDMAGDLNEWCWDWYSSSYYSASPGSDPIGPSSGSHRVLRGGCWSDNASYSRTAFRYDLLGPAYSTYGLGFRSVRR